MFKDAKIPLIILSLICIILLGSTAALYSMKEGEKTQKLSFQKYFNEATAMKQALEGKLKETEITNAELKVNIKSLEDKIDALSQQLEKENTVNIDIAAKLQAKELDIQGLKSNVESAKAEKEDQSKRLEKLNEDYLNMKFQLENMIKTKEELERKVKEFAEKENVSLGTIVIKQPAK